MSSDNCAGVIVRWPLYHLYRPHSLYPSIDAPTPHLPTRAQGTMSGSPNPGNTTTPLPAPPVFQVSLSVERQWVKEVVRAVLGTILFQRVLGNLKPTEREICSVTFPVPADPAVEALINKHVDAFARALDHTASTKAVLGGEEREEEERDEDECGQPWEGWIVEVEIAVGGRGGGEEKLRSQLSDFLLRLLTYVSTPQPSTTSSPSSSTTSTLPQTHVPPITSADVQPFGVQILINPSSSQIPFQVPKNVIESVRRGDGEQRGRFREHPRRDSLDSSLTQANREGSTASSFASTSNFHPPPSPTPGPSTDVIYELTSVLGLLAQVGHPSYEHQINTMQETIKEPPKRLKLVFLGDTGSGKATLLNALIDRDLFPTGSSDACTTTRADVWFDPTKEKSKFYAKVHWVEASEVRKLFETVRLERDDPSEASDEALATIFTIFPMLSRTHVLEMTDAEIENNINSLPIHESFNYETTSFDRFRRTVEPYLGSMSGTDHLGPLIRKVEIFLWSELLEKGLQISDRPGLHDCVASRSAKAREEWDENTELCVVVKQCRAGSDIRFPEILELIHNVRIAKNLELPATVVATFADSPATPKEVISLNPKCAHQLNIIQKNIEVLERSLAEEKRRHDSIKSAFKKAKTLELMKQLLDSDNDVDEAMQSFDKAVYERHVFCKHTRDKIIELRLVQKLQLVTKGLFEEDGYEAEGIKSVKSFSVAATDYLAIRNVGERTTAPTLELADTGIPKLRAHVENRLANVAMGHLREAVADHLADQIVHPPTNSITSDPAFQAALTTGFAQLNAVMKAYLDQLHPNVHRCIESLNEELSKAEKAVQNDLDHHLKALGGDEQWNQGRHVKKETRTGPAQVFDWSHELHLWWVSGLLSHWVEMLDSQSAMATKFEQELLARTQNMLAKLIHDFPNADTFLQPVATKLIERIQRDIKKSVQSALSSLISWRDRAWDANYSRFVKEMEPFYSEALKTKVQWAAIKPGEPHLHVPLRHFANSSTSTVFVRALKPASDEPSVYAKAYEPFRTELQDLAAIVEVKLYSICNKDVVSTISKQLLPSPLPSDRASSSNAWKQRAMDPQAIKEVNWKISQLERMVGSTEMESPGKRRRRSVEDQGGDDETAVPAFKNLKLTKK
ncbi:hypothetical protein MNV49_003980 [Pseudohyphozyma bogoriensis]|nr:hypothetical protein MNV49_003980 [Pseudohyphozyma bogoriensis]